MISSLIANALETLRPGAQWVFHNEDLSTLEWLDKKQTRPTDDEIKAAMTAYVPPPSVEEQLAALWAGGDVAKAMAQRLADIKAKTAKSAAPKAAAAVVDPGQADQLQAESLGLTPKSS